MIFIGILALVILMLPGEGSISRKQRPKCQNDNYQEDPTTNEQTRDLVLYSSSEQGNLQTQPRSGVNPWANTPSNQYLFRNSLAFSQYHSSFKGRKVSDTYYFKEETDNLLSQWEHDKIEQYMNFWSWKPLLELRRNFWVRPIQILYANMVETNEPYGVKTWMDGKEILIDAKVITDVLHIEETGERAYVRYKWPNNVETFASYKQWLGSKDPSKDYSDTNLPAVHRLAFMFIDYILTPGIGIKTTFQMIHAYLLRHLIAQDKVVNIPFIILSHMRATLKNPMMSLPYPHLLWAILRHKNISIKNDTDQKEHPYLNSPTNLVTLLHKK